jgi:signal transduction histidine kinase
MSPATATQPLHREQELASIIAAYNEVTEQLRLSHEQLEYQVRRLRDELADKNRELARKERLAALGQMAAGLAHEIRNPLGGIRLFASLLEKDLAQQPEPLALTRKISSGVSSLNQLVCDILDFAGEIRLQPSLLDAGELIHECVELLAAEIDRHRSRVVIEAADDTALTADAKQLRSALLNLLRNAIEAAGDDGCVCITVSESDERESLRLQIADNGPGIPPEHMDKVFNPFFTTKETGTGLGLSMVHRIIDAHGGHVRVTAGPQGGACFVIELPLRPPVTSAVVPQEVSV